MENFRSTRDLIDAYNHILDPSADPPFLDGEIRYDQPVTAGRELVVEQARWPARDADPLAEDRAGRRRFVVDRLS